MLIRFDEQFVARHFAGVPGCKRSEIVNASDGVLRRDIRLGELGKAQPFVFIVLLMVTAVWTMVEGVIKVELVNQEYDSTHSGRLYKQ